MFNHNHSRPDEGTTADVIDMFARKRDSLTKKYGAEHPSLRSEQTRATLATVTPIGAARHRQISSGD